MTPQLVVLVAAAGAIFGGVVTLAAYLCWLAVLDRRESRR